MNKGKRTWFKHFHHENMFVCTTDKNDPRKSSGWNFKGRRFENEFHLIDSRCTEVTDPELIEKLNAEFDKG